jgi:hypothetical protein
MKTNIANISFLLIVGLRIMYNPSQSKKELSPFANPRHLSAFAISVVPANPVGPHAGSNERLILKWIIGDNREGTCFNLSAPVNEFYEMPGNEIVLKDIN